MLHKPWDMAECVKEHPVRQGRTIPCTHMLLFWDMYKDLEILEPDQNRGSKECRRWWWEIGDDAKRPVSARKQHKQSHFLLDLSPCQKQTFSSPWLASKSSFTRWNFTPQLLVPSTTGCKWLSTEVRHTNSVKLAIQCPSSESGSTKQHLFLPSHQENCCCLERAKKGTFRVLDILATPPL